MCIVHNYTSTLVHCATGVIEMVRVVCQKQQCRMRYCAGQTGGCDGREMIDKDRRLEGVG